MDNSTYEIRFSSWKSVIEASENRPQGVSKRQWLIDNGIPESNTFIGFGKSEKLLFLS